MLSCSVVSDSVQPLWTVARQDPLSMGFSRQEYWSGLPFPSPGDLPNPGIKPASFVSPAWAGRFFYHWATWEATGKIKSFFFSCCFFLFLISSAGTCHSERLPLPEMRILPSTELLSEFPRYDHIWTAKSCLLNSKAKLSLKLFLGAASLKVTQPKPSYISRAKSLSTATAVSHSGCLVEVRGTMLLTEENETVTHSGFLLAHSTQDQICSRRATGMKYSSAWVWATISTERFPSHWI